MFNFFFLHIYFMELTEHSAGTVDVNSLNRSEGNRPSLSVCCLTSSRKNMAT